MKKLITLATFTALAVCSFAGTWTDGNGNATFPENGTTWGRTVNANPNMRITCDLGTTKWKLLDFSNNVILSGTGSRFFGYISFAHTVVVN
jgi:hypothetical protein